MIDAANSGARQLAEQLAKSAESGSGSGSGSAAAGGSEQQASAADQTRFAQAMSGGDTSTQAASTPASTPAAASTSEVSSVGTMQKPPSAGDRILGGIDKMRDGFTESTAQMQQAVEQKNLSPQDLMRVQMNVVKFSTTESIDSKAAGTAKSDLDKLLNA